MTRFHSLPVLFLVTGLAACDSQMGPDYPGDPLATVKGTVKVETAASPGGTNASIVWINSAASPDVSVGETVPVTGSFPAGFRLDVLTPPVDAALNDYTRGGNTNETRIGIAMIMALPAGYDPASKQDPGPGWGVSERHVLTYVESDIMPGTHSAELVGGALPAGFHILEVIDVDHPACASDIFDCLRPTPLDLDTQVEVRIADPATLDIPNWT